MMVDDNKIKSSPSSIDNISPSEYMRIEPRKPLSWTDDKIGIQCYHCSKLFTLFRRNIIVVFVEEYFVMIVVIYLKYYQII